MRTDVFDLQAGRDPPPPAAVVCENVLRLRWIFFDDRGEAQDEWDSDSEDGYYATPRAVELTIEVGEQDAGRAVELTIEVGEQDAGRIYRTRIAPVMVREARR